MNKWVVFVLAVDCFVTFLALMPDKKDEPSVRETRPILLWYVSALIFLLNLSGLWAALK